MTWPQVLTLLTPALLTLLSSIMAWLKSRQAAAHAQNASEQAGRAAQHAAMSHDMLVRRGQ